METLKPTHTCALCHKAAPLCLSHILPKFAQRRMKGMGRILSAAPQRNEFLPVQDFAKEKLLCAGCEQTISRWESDAARLFNQRETFDLPLLPENLYYENEGLPYHSTKLYLLSLLWRMSVSNIPDCREVDLGPHEETIRLMLVGGEPGRAADYGCMLQVVIDSKGRIPITRSADRYRIEPTMVLYRLLLDGFLLTWFVGSAEANRRCQMKGFFLQENGTWNCRVVPRNEVPFLRVALAGILE